MDTHWRVDFGALTRHVGLRAKQVKGGFQFVVVSIGLHDPEGVGGIKVDSDDVLFRLSR